MSALRVIPVLLLWTVALSAQEEKKASGSVDPCGEPVPASSQNLIERPDPWVQQYQLKNERAEELAKSLDCKMGVRVIAVNPTLLSIQGRYASQKTTYIPGLLQVISSADKSLERSPRYPQGPVIRLYNSREAEAIAKVLNDTYPNRLEVAALGKDLLLFKKFKPGDEKLIEDISRYVAIIDLPRPQVRMNVWSVQISAKRSEETDRVADQIRAVVEQHNLQLVEGIDRGWAYLQHGIREDTFHPEFRDYITDRFLGCRSDIAKLPAGTTRTTARCSTANQRDVCSNKYCLGYFSAFSDATPTLGKMLLLLAAVRDEDDPAKTVSARDVASGLVDCMESADCIARDPRTGQASIPPSAMLKTASKLGSMSTCDDNDVDLERIQAYEQTPSAVQFIYLPRFRKALCRAMTGRRHRALRAAMASFLFERKWAIQFPNSFIPYSLQHSADTLDSQLAPIVEAFNADMASFLAHVQRTIIPPKGSKVSFSSNGTVSVLSLSGAQAQVNTQTMNFFDATEPFTIANFLKRTAEVQEGMSPILQSNLNANTAAAVAAALTTEKKAVAKLGRGLNLTITANTQPNAAGAELEVNLDARETPQGEVVYEDGTKKEDETSRVALHTVSDRVRVENLKLFEISAFSAELQRRNSYIPVPVLGELPYLGPAFRIPRGTERRYHRSFAIINAVIVPTAADLAESIGFAGDRWTALDMPEEKPEGNLYVGFQSSVAPENRIHEVGQLPPQARPFHYRFVSDCLMLNRSCDLTLGDVAPDTR